LEAYERTTSTLTATEDFNEDKGKEHDRHFKTVKEFQTAETTENTSAKITKQLFQLRLRVESIKQQSVSTACGHSVGKGCYNGICNTVGNGVRNAVGNTTATISEKFVEANNAKLIVSNTTASAVTHVRYNPVLPANTSRQSISQPGNGPRGRRGGNCHRRNNWHIGNVSVLPRNLMNSCQ
jgi:hypothetical protein